MADSIPQLFELLGRNPGELIRDRQPETIWLDFKMCPYQLEQDRQRFELAKDVSAMANAEGGVILIGIERSGMRWHQRMSPSHYDPWRWV